MFQHSKTYEAIYLSTSKEKLWECFHICAYLWKTETYLCEVLNLFSALSTFYTVSLICFLHLGRRFYLLRDSANVFIWGSVIPSAIGLLEQNGICLLPAVDAGGFSMLSSYLHNLFFCFFFTDFALFLFSFFFTDYVLTCLQSSKQLKLTLPAIVVIKSHKQSWTDSSVNR